MITAHAILEVDENIIIINHITVEDMGAVMGAAEGINFDFTW